MILDGLLSFTTVGTPQAITVTAVSNNILDLAALRDVGIGDNPAMKLAIFISETFTAGVSKYDRGGYYIIISTGGMNDSSIQRLRVGRGQDRCEGRGDEAQGAIGHQTRGRHAPRPH